MATLPQLAIKPEQQPSPIQQAGQVLSLKDLMQSSQAQQIQLQNAQQDQDDQQKFRQAFTEANGDPDKTVQIAAKAGVGPKLLVPYQQSVLDRKTKLMTYSKDQLDLQQKQADVIQGAHDKVTAADPADRPAVYAQQTQALKGMGLDTSQFPPQYPGDEAFKTIGAAVQGHGQMIKDAQSASEASKNTAQGREASARATLDENKANIAANYQKDPSQLLAQVDAAAPAVQYPGLNMRTKSLVAAALKNGDVESATKAINEASQQVGGIEKEINPAVQANKIATATAEGKARAAIQNGGLGSYNVPAGAKGEDALANLDPATASVVRQIGDGKQDFATMASRMPPAAKTNLAALVAAYNPNFDQATFKIQTKAAEKATSGQWADTRVAYNTGLDHSKNLLDAVDALNNGDVKKLNSLKNYFKTEFGSPDVPTYDAIANAYNHEVTAVISKGHMTDKEVETGHAVLPDNASPQTLRKVIGAYQNLVLSKRDELDKVIKAGSGNKADAVLGVKSSSDAGTQQTVGHKIGDVIVQNGRSFKATKVDANGKVTAADPQ